MCTVTYVKRGKQIILTSNRDEHTTRPAALAPETYLVDNKKLTFPKDPKGGGTWFAVDENGNAAVLLNGAQFSHQPGGTYRKSRGLVLIEMLAAASPVAGWAVYDLDDIEPFTVVLVEGGALYQLRWDGKEKESVSLDPDMDYIWSSSTLYAPEVQQERTRWFTEFLSAKPVPDPAAMKLFHSGTANGNPENGLVISRDNGMKTFSITQAVIGEGEARLYHYDLLRKQSHTPVNF